MSIAVPSGTEVGVVVFRVDADFHALSQTCMFTFSAPHTM